MKKLKVILSIVAMVILIPILFISGVILINSYKKPNEIPSFFGYKPFIVLSGSMETEIYSGDIAVAKVVDVNTLKVGDVIAYRSGDSVITHRIVEKVNDSGENKFVTKGDNNNVKDKNYVSFDSVEGKYIFKIKGLGNFAMFLQTPIGMIVCLSIPIILLAVVSMLDNKQKRKNSMDKEKELRDEIEKLKKEKDALSKN